LIFSLVERRPAVPGGRCRPNGLQAVDGSGISVHEFDVAGAGLGHAAAEPALLDPGVQRRPDMRPFAADTFVLCLQSHSLR
jgi:hypothetical protein